MREFKGLPQFTKDIQGRVVVGIASVFNNVDHIDDRVHPGAFTRTINAGRSRIKHLWNHNFGDPPIASIKNIQEVGRDALPAKVLEYAPEATGGLEVSREYYEDNPLSNWVFQAVKREDINEMSFGFDALTFDFTTVGEGAAAQRIRELREVRLYDTSDVNWGMNGATVGSKALVYPFEQIAAHLQAFTQAVKEGKAGRRNRATDLELINSIHQASIDLGCETCAGVKAGEKSREPGPGDHTTTPLLSDLRAALDELNVAAFG